VDNIYQIQHVVVAPADDLIIKPKVYTGTESADFAFYTRLGSIVTGAGVKLCGGCWAGQGAGKNNPDKVSVHKVGPLPPGLYRIGFLQDGGHLGPEVLALTQVFGDSYGRSGFYIHGSNAAHPETSSEGCIIAPRFAREAINKGCSSARLLRVI